MKTTNQVNVKEMNFDQLFETENMEDNL